MAQPGRVLPRRDRSTDKSVGTSDGWGVYVLVGFFIIVAIFRMAGVYVQAMGG